MLTPKFDWLRIKNQLKQAQLQKHKKCIEVLAYLGELCTNHAKESGDYKDRTSNLRNSIGYVVIFNGRVVYENFEKSQSGKIEVFYSSIKTRELKSTKIESGIDGVSTGRSFAYSLSQKYHTGYALVVVAGMNYASYVEATGRDVLSSAEHLAQERLPNLLKTLKLK